MSERFAIIDVGCIECGMQTELVGIYESEEDARAAFDKAANERGLKKWNPRGGFLEMLGLHGHEVSTFIGGTGYFSSGGQKALELHVLPGRKVENPFKEEGTE